MIVTRGTSFAIVQRFASIDPLTGIPTAANPDSVVFEIAAPDGTTTTYTFGVAPNVTNPEVGTFVCTLSPPLPTGTYRYVCVGSGSVDATGTETFQIDETGVLAPTDPTVAVLGPCQPWINGTDVSAYDPTLGVGTAAWQLDDVAAVASSLMYEVSGRQFLGVCQTTVRPCRRPCSCWGGPSFGLGPFYWTTSEVSGYGFGWWNESGDRCGCGTESYLRLAGYPVREILAVKIDGVVLDPSEYRLDERRFLIRTADLTKTPPTDRFWPACQDLSLPDTQPGTYSVAYSYGADVPQLGKWAASELAAELWKAFPANKGECRLPTRVTRVVRAGVTLDRVLPTADLIRQGGTGLQFVDSFIAAYNPTKLRRRAKVYSPDIARYGKRAGQ